MDCRFIANGCSLVSQFSSEFNKSGLVVEGSISHDRQDCTSTKNDEYKKRGVFLRHLLLHIFLFDLIFGFHMNRNMKHNLERKNGYLPVNHHQRKFGVSSVGTNEGVDVDDELEDGDDIDTFM
ncbi:hypothetical protein Dimus_024424 [Dionaea muscipula]